MAAVPTGSNAFSPYTGTGKLTSIRSPQSTRVNRRGYGPYGRPIPWDAPYPIPITPRSVSLDIYPTRPRRWRGLRTEETTALSQGRRQGLSNRAHSPRARLNMVLIPSSRGRKTGQLPSLMGAHTLLAAVRAEVKTWKSAGLSESGLILRTRFRPSFHPFPPQPQDGDS